MTQALYAHMNNNKKKRSAAFISCHAQPAVFNDGIGSL
jgi:hypothetical protein